MRAKVSRKGQPTNFLVLDSMDRPYKIKMLTRSAFSLTKWYSKYAVNSLLFQQGCVTMKKAGQRTLCTKKVKSDGRAGPWHFIEWIRHRNLQYQIFIWNNAIKYTQIIIMYYYTKYIYQIIQSLVLCVCVYMYIYIYIYTLCDLQWGYVLISPL